MSFYNVTNPTSFSVVSDTRKMLTQAGKLVRSAAVANLTTFLGTTATSPITPEQLVQGVLFVNPNTTSQNFFLPRAQDLINLLMGPGGFDVSSNDIFTFRIFNINGGANNVVVKINSLDTSPTNSGGDITIGPGSSRSINLQITINNGAYSYAMF
jgi:hypothetical protein